MDEKIESLFELAGNSNRYQFLLAIITFLIWINLNILSVSLGLFEKLPDVEFYDPFSKQNVSSTLNSTICEWEDNYTITKNYSHSVVTSFNYDCDAILIGLLGTATFLGNLLGCFIFQYLIEKLGRKKTVIVNFIPLVASLGIIIFSPSYVLLVVFFFLSEIFCVNIVFSTYLICSEVTCSKKRSSLGAFLSSGFAFCGILYSIYCKYIANWRLVFTICLGSNVIFVSAFILLSYESPRFYLVKNDFEKFIRELHNIASANNRLGIFKVKIEEEGSPFKEAYDFLKIHIGKRNKNLSAPSDEKFDEFNDKINTSGEESVNTGIVINTYANDKDGQTKLNNGRSEKKEDPFEHNALKKKLDEEKNKSIIDLYLNQKNKNAQEFNLFDFFRYASIRYKFLSLCFIWLTSSGSYYGLSLNIKNINTDVYFYSIINYGFEILIYIISGYLINLKFLGRKITMSVFYSIANLGLILYVFVGLEQQVTNIVLLIVRLCISANYGIIFIYTLEIYPSPARARGFGMNNAVSKFTPVIFPILVEIFPKIIFYIYLFMNCLCLLFITVFIPETLGKPLKEMIEEEEFAEKEKMSNLGFADKESPLLNGS